MAFVKGQSGNPRGRPKVDFEVRAAARLHGESAIEKLVAIMTGEDQRLALSAASTLLDRGFGKPSQSVEVTGEGGSALSLAVSFVERKD